MTAKQTTKEQTTEQKPKMGTGGRASAGTTVEVKQPTVTTVKLGQQSHRDPFWYLEHKGELESVTANPENEAIGIKRVGVFPPSEAQAANGVIASISLDTIIGNVRGIQIKESKDAPGALYLQTGSKNIAKAGEPAKWLNEIKLERTASAQILSYVDSLLVKSE